jgi:hypothetical protein
VNGIGNECWVWCFQLAADCMDHDEGECLLLWGRRIILLKSLTNPHDRTEQLNLSLSFVKLFKLLIHLRD